MWLITPPVDVLECMTFSYMAGAGGGHMDIHLGTVEIESRMVALETLVCF